MQPGLLKTNHDNFYKVAQFLDTAPATLAIVGGAVRDLVCGRAIKDYDVLIFDHEVEVFLDYAERLGWEITKNTLSGDKVPADSSGSTSDFNTRYCGLVRLEAVGLIIDLLVVPTPSYYEHLPSWCAVLLPEAFETVVHSYDYSINHWIYYHGEIKFIGGKFGLCQRIKSVNEDRQSHVRDIAIELGWVWSDD